MSIIQTLPYTLRSLGPVSFLMLHYTLHFRTMVSHVVPKNLIAIARRDQDYGLVSQALGLSKALVKHKTRNQSKYFKTSPSGVVVCNGYNSSITAVDGT